jgi:ABC-type nitrate/sulfonate/bicarbonate transport system ATPase subunit
MQTLGDFLEWWQGGASGLTLPRGPLGNSHWEPTKFELVTHNVAEAVYLADRIVVLTPHPGAVKTDLPIGLPRMRDPLRGEFLDHQRAVIAHLTGSAEGR